LRRTLQYMDGRDTYRRALIEACGISGDEAALAARLHKPKQLLVEWLLGTAPIPVEVFLEAVDIVIESQKQSVQETERFLQRIRQRHGR
jgi:hypothetical protein